MSESLRPFHLAFPVKDLQQTKQFFVDLLQCRIGRESDRWVDFDFFGHQITAHLDETLKIVGVNDVDGDQVPVRHFGMVLSWDQWHSLRDTLEMTGVDFLLSPKIRFRGEPGEQATLFIRDPSGNALEFKAFKSEQSLFAR